MTPRTILTKALYDQRRGLVGWSIGIAAMTALFIAIYPMIREMPDIDVLLEQYPEAFGQLFDIDAIMTGPGFLNAEMFSLLAPVLFIVYGIGRGARAVAGEEENGTLEVLLSTPIARSRVLAEKALALLAGLVVLAVVLFTVGWPSRSRASPLSSRTCSSRWVRWSRRSSPGSSSHRSSTPWAPIPSSTA